MAIYDIFSTLETLGAFDIVLPFLLIFTISFSVMDKINLFGTGKKNVSLIVALVLAFFSVRNIFLTSLLQRFLPNVAMFLVIILMFLLMIGTFTGQTPGFGGWGGAIAIIFSLIAIIMALSSDFLGQFGYEFNLPPFIADLFYDYQTRAMVLLIGGAIIVIALATSSQNTGGDDWWTKGRQFVNDILGRGP